MKTTGKKLDAEFVAQYEFQGQQFLVFSMGEYARLSNPTREMLADLEEGDQATIEA